ncbi:Sorting nexin-4 [Amphibalanus amphitrite]|uniref:Sorting nexin-4 n=1 Tax=Amphibalanus amphitrite TaxID=1232801 RepID=A0A6A4X1A5_AMPAM|nr:Sorting nexin-4 [Amphibalanus amphitrite]KAF0313486.1 Sorting nexin-4 [Amphibalanus amphitrite]
MDDHDAEENGISNNLPPEANGTGALETPQPPGADAAEKDFKKEPLCTVMEISVSESERRYNGSMNLTEYYTAYLIETRVTEPTFGGALSRQGALWRRYSEFETLAGYLGEAYPYVVTPPLPEKRASHVWQKLATDPFDSEFIDRRRVGLEDERDWKEIVTGTGYLEKVERQLKSLNATIRVKKGDSRFDELLTYGRELETHLSNVLRSRARLTDATYAVRRQHANYGRVLSQWSAVETQMGDGLQRAGHYMDAHAASIDTFVEEEEVYIDQLKEYMYYAAALQAVCHKYTMRQYQLERLDDTLSQLSQRRENALQGKPSLMWRLLGSVDTDEVREMKVADIDQQVADTEQQIRQHTEQLSEFVEKALEDVQRFHSRKVKDLRETIVNYMKLQIRICKKGLQTWRHFRDCVDSLEGQPPPVPPPQEIGSP